MLLIVVKGTEPASGVEMSSSYVHYKICCKTQRHVMENFAELASWPDNDILR